MKNNTNIFNELMTRDGLGFFENTMKILPNPDKILRKTGKTIEAYRSLKNDPHVWSCIQSRKSGLLSLEYSITPNGAATNIVNEVNSIFHELDINRIQRDILEAPFFGYQPLEILWKVTDGDRKFIVPADVVAKPQEWFFFDSKGIFKYRLPGEIDGVEAPEYKILNVQYEASYTNPYGDALLSKCYWPVTFKNGGLKFWVNFTERYGMPILIGQYTRGASQDEAQELADSLAGMNQDAVIVTPGDISIDLKEAVRTSSANLYKELIKFCNSEISKAILSQTLTTEIDMGSYAAAETHYKIRREVILSDIKLVEGVMNKLIKYIVDLNFAPPYPKFNVIINDSENVSLVDRDLKIAQTGQVKFTKEYWMNKYGFKESEINSEF